MILMSDGFVVCFNNSSIVIALPFAAVICSLAVLLNASAATVMLCWSSPLPSTLPGTTMISFGLVCRASLLTLTILRERVAFSRSSAILFQSAALRVLLSLRSSWMSVRVPSFVGPVRFMV